jgi:hypothetical protein
MTGANAQGFQTFQSFHTFQSLTDSSDGLNDLNVSNDLNEPISTRNLASAYTSLWDELQTGQGHNARK